jgi:hypothetical protein
MFQCVFGIFHWFCGITIRTTLVNFVGTNKVRQQDLFSSLFGVPQSVFGFGCGFSRAYGFLCQNVFLLVSFNVFA